MLRQFIRSWSWRLSAGHVENDSDNYAEVTINAGVITSHFCSQGYACEMLCELTLNERIPLISPTATLRGSGATYTTQTIMIKSSSLSAELQVMSASPFQTCDCHVAVFHIASAKRISHVIDAMNFIEVSES